MTCNSLTRYISLFYARDTHREMASKGNTGQLTQLQIVRLAAKIAAKNMAPIAEGYMGIDEATIENKKYENKDDADAFNRAMLRTWANRNPENQVHVNKSIIGLDK